MLLKEQAKYNTFQSDCINPLFPYTKYISCFGNLESMHLSSEKKGTVNKKPRPRKIWYFSYEAKKVTSKHCSLNQKITC